MESQVKDRAIDIQRVLGVQLLQHSIQNDEGPCATHTSTETHTHTPNSSLKTQNLTKYLMFSTNTEQELSSLFPALVHVSHVFLARSAFTFSSTSYHFLENMSSEICPKDRKKEGRKRKIRKKERSCRFVWILFFNDSVL